jgi:hypothetical protein
MRFDLTFYPIMYIHCVVGIVPLFRLVNVIGCGPER